MFTSSRPKFLLCFLKSSPPTISLPLRTLRWVSTGTPQASSPSLRHLQSLFNSDLPPENHNHELAIIAALKSCSTHLAVSQGQQIHCLVLKSGLKSNTFVQNSVINMYAKCGLLADARSFFDSCRRLDPVSCTIMLSGYVKNGELDEAREMFDVMPRKGCIAYTTMILGLVQNECWSEAIEIFKDMRHAGVVPSDVTMTSVIHAGCHLGLGTWNCRMLHGLVTKLLGDGFLLIATNLVKLYCLCSSLGDARALFDKMPERNIVSWNVMLNGYSKAGIIDLAMEVFEGIPDKDIVSWGTIIDGFIRLEKLGEAFVMYRSMVSTGLRPSEVMMVDLISTCGRKVAVGEGLQLHSVIAKLGFDSRDFMQSTLIHYYAACGKVNEAHLQFEVSTKDHVASWNALIAGFMRNRMIDKAKQLFNDMPERDVFSWSSMISGYTQNQQPWMAFELFHGMVASGIRPNEVTMVSVFSSIAALGTLKEGKWAHEFVQNSSIPLNDNLSAAIIDMFAKCGSINSALEVFYQIRDRTSTVSPWNAIICGLAMHGHANLSLKLYSDLQERRIKLNAITFIGVLSACCHAGLVELGERYFESMKPVYNVDPDIKHYGCMVDLLGRAGRLEEAEKMIMNMPMQADVVIWGTLLAACKTLGNIDIGERAAENLARLHPSHGASRVLLSNLYADAGLWEDAFLVRRAMQSHGMHRLPGFSGVT